MPGAGETAADVEPFDGPASSGALAGLLDVLAVLGEDVGVAEVAHALGVDDSTAVEALAELELIGQVRARPPARFALAPTARAERIAAMTVAEQAQVQRRAAEALHRCGHPPGRVAAHLGAAYPFCAPWAIEAQREAARAARRRGARDEAVERLDWCVSAGCEGAVRTEMVIELAQAELAAGREEGAERLRWLARTITERPALVRIGEVLYSMGRFAEAVATFAAVLDARCDGWEQLDEWGARALAGDIVSRLLMGESIPGRLASLDRLVQSLPDDAGLRRGPVPAILLATAAGTLALGVDRRVPVVRGWLDAVADSGRAMPRSLLESHPAALVFCGEPARAIEVLDAGLAEAVSEDAVVEYTSLRAIRAFAMFVRGDLSAAEADADDVLRLSRRTPTASRAAIGPARYAIVSASVLRGEFGHASQALESPALDGAGLMTGWDALARGTLALVTGRPDAALAAFRAAGRAFTVNGASGLLGGWRGRAAEALLLLGRVGEAIGLLEDEVRFARDAGAVGSEAAASRLLSRTVPDPAARALALEAVVALADSGAPMVERAAARIEWGMALRRADDRAAARDALRDGAALARACGATQLDALATGELSAAGARAVARPLTGAESLSPSERRVAELAARPATNREIARMLFLSVKTVETHLSSVYRKLGVAGRRHLAAALAPPPDSGGDGSGDPGGRGGA
ncbi:helix-turn-helix transcriptional regulator [Microbacterium thalassium]|uniref:DNA-binding CsgD family transcriptional regulator/uncharacterized protein with PIN domain n=1 Tax=Microbacterium thalassium TaxID=362649 RepID=A0A7X0FSH6_9MICO|nr:helix-turn-helix transcriptional regulator [Microbacterium thalassium]MBB6392900.1 DNA-binding CsgD family transcriptional regulator/uncharacterized protein with PIN domain [Microbacterium thalassium]GLK22869.1 hypothetical protein GCM10017607_01870 [Microbacterium thalassium]